MLRDFLVILAVYLLTIIIIFFSESSFKIELIAILGAYSLLILIELLFFESWRDNPKPKLERGR